MGDFSKKLLDRVKDSLGDVVDEIDDDDLKEAVSNCIELNDMISDLVEEEPAIKEALKKKLKKLLIDNIEAIDDGDEMEGYMSTSWSDEMENIFEITDMVKEIVDEDPDLKEKLREKVKELLTSELENLSEEDLPEMSDLLQKLNFDTILQEVLRDEETMAAFTTSVRDAIKEKMDNEFSSDDLPENLWDDNFIVNRIKVIMVDSNFQNEFIEGFDRALKRTVLSMMKVGDTKFDKIVKEHPMVQSVIQNQLGELLRDVTFLDDLKKMLINRVADGNPDLHKLLLNSMINSLVEHLVEGMFKKI